MRRLIVAALASALACVPLAADARSSSSHSRGHSAHSSSHSSSHASHHTWPGAQNHHKAVGVARDKHGKIARSAKAKDAFRHSHPCPSTGRTTGACKGYVIDHRQALKHGGSDTPDNMEWQTTDAAKLKDRIE